MKASQHWQPRKMICSVPFLVNLFLVQGWMVVQSLVAEEYYTPTHLREACGKAGNSRHFAVDDLNFTSNGRRRRDVGCDCGYGTVVCLPSDLDSKLCKCANDRFVLNGDCQDCHCENALCDIPNDSCECLRGYAQQEGKCTKCECGNNEGCHFEGKYKICFCENGHISVNSTCNDCVCDPNEICFHKHVQKSWINNGTDEANNNCEGIEDCDCTGDFCISSYRKKFCICMPGFSMLNGKCAECKCDEDYNFTCSFVHGLKTCHCREGYAEIDKVCKECECGKGHGCEFAEGSKTCLCKENHFEHEGLCKTCNCTQDQVCEVKNNSVTCLCKENYKADNNGTCRECFCGDEHSCEIIEGRKVCICLEKHVYDNGTCKECDCGEGHVCEFRNGEKFCKCSPNHADFKGICEECWCGEESTCLFENGEKVCICKDGFIQKGGECHECFCGENSTCIFESGKKTCNCPDHYKADNGTCKEMCHKNICIQGICEEFNQTSYCRCDKGFSGSRCDQEALGLTGAGPYLISAVPVVIILITFVAVYILIRKRRRYPSYNRVSYENRNSDVSAIYPEERHVKKIEST